MNEAVHLPRLLSMPVRSEHASQPGIVSASHGLRQEMRPLDGVRLCRIPKHFEDLLPFGGVSLRLPRITENGIGFHRRQLPEISAEQKIQATKRNLAAFALDSGMEVPAPGSPEECIQ